ncbi:MAG: septum formation initiator family protein [Fibromonadales bacterium]|nr:septum formation initiator family protein [Fibromonadales bacterium]
MLGKRKKTGAQIMLDITKRISGEMDSFGKRRLPIAFICKICIILFSFSICFGFYGLVSRMNDISKKEHSIEMLKNEQKSMESELDKKQKLKIALIDDLLAIEAVARSYGMTKKEEKAFYFLD